MYGKASVDLGFDWLPSSGSKSVRAEHCFGKGAEHCFDEGAKPYVSVPKTHNELMNRDKSAAAGLTQY